MTEREQIERLRSALKRIAWADVSSDNFTTIQMLRDAARAVLAETEVKAPTVQTNFACGICMSVNGHREWCRYQFGGTDK